MTAPGDPSFIAFPKLPRLHRDVAITEKIDGTNAAVIVTAPYRAADVTWGATVAATLEDGTQVLAQSRKRIITPGKGTDNHGFAGWVAEHAEVLAELGVGHHYGEWWGNGIQRGYGLENGDKRFSVFNPDYTLSPELRQIVGTVPVLRRGTGDQLNELVRAALGDLQAWGSKAAPGFKDPEGIVIFHAAARQLFKVTLEDDTLPKSLIPVEER